MQNAIATITRKTVAALATSALVLGTFATAIIPVAQAAVAPNWDVTGSYVMDQEYLGSHTAHTVSLSQDNAGDVTGSGTAGAYTWVIDSGSVSGDTLTFTAHYTATADAVTPLTTLNVTTAIAPDGTMTGTWSDNYQGGERTGTWSSTSGAATPLPTSTVVMTDPATNITATDATFNGTDGNTAADNSSFWVSTSTYTPVGGASPTMPAGVYSTAALGPVAANTAFSALLSSVAQVLPVTASTTYYFNAWVNTNGVWTPGTVMNFTTSPAPAMPVISSISPNTGSTAGGTVVTITGSGFTGATAVDFGMTPATTMTVNNDTSITATSPATTTAGVTDVTVTTAEGTSTMGASDQFTYTAASGSIGGTVTGGPGVLTVTSITPVKTSAISDNTYADGWSYLFNVTVPTNEPNLSMSFDNWMSGANIIAAGGNMQISSAQAAASTTPVSITAANVYSTPPLVMTGDLSTSTPGLQVQILVQVKIPVNTVVGNYTTNYGVQTLP